MHINKIGYNYRHTGNFNIYRPQGSGDMVLVLVTTPTVFTIGGKEIDLAPETLIILRPDTPNIYHGTGDIFANHWFHFTPTDESYFEALGIPLDTPITGFPTTALSELILKMANEYSAAGMHSDAILSDYIDIFFHTLSRLMSSNVSAAASELTETRNAIYNMPYKKWDVETLASMAGYSRSYFSHKYREDFGTSPMQDVVESKMIYAKYLLESTGYRVNEISEMCGFDRPVYFIYIFKKKVGCTPTEFRKSTK